MARVNTIDLDGKSYVILPMADYVELQQRATGDAPNLPELPQADADGNFPAIEYSRVLLARKLITQRRAAGLTQAELAKASGVRVETISRLELAKHSADPATVEKLDKAMLAATAPAKAVPPAPNAAPSLPPAMLAEFDERQAEKPRKTVRASQAQVRGMRELPAGVAAALPRPSKRRRSAAG